MPNYRIVYNDPIQHDAFSRGEKSKKRENGAKSLNEKYRKKSSNGQESKTIQCSKDYIDTVVFNSGYSEKKAAKYFAKQFLDGFKNVDEDLFDAWYAVGQTNKSTGMVSLTINARMK